MQETVEAYHKRWQNDKCLFDNAPIAPGCCIVWEMTEGFLGIAEGCLIFHDFGDAVDYYCYQRLANDLLPDEPQNIPVSGVIEEYVSQPIKIQHPKEHWTQEERKQRYVKGVAELNALLERFVQEGYHPDMRSQLKDLLNRTRIEYKVDVVYVIPEDLDELLGSLGNPLVDYDAYENENEAEAHAPAFNLNNPEHRAALKERIEVVGC